MKKLYQEIASRIDAIKRCEESGNSEWQEKHEEILDRLIDMLPSGSGIDAGNNLAAESTPEKVVIESSYHAMNEYGMYTHWINYKLTITPSLMRGYDMRIVGRFGKDKDIKEYLYDTYAYALDSAVSKDAQKGESA